METENSLGNLTQDKNDFPKVQVFMAVVGSTPNYEREIEDGALYLNRS